MLLRRGAFLLGFDWVFKFPNRINNTKLECSQLVIYVIFEAFWKKSNVLLKKRSGLYGFDWTTRRFSFERERLVGLYGFDWTIRRFSFGGSGSFAFDVSYLTPLCCVVLC